MSSLLSQASQHSHQLAPSSQPSPSYNVQLPTATITVPASPRPPDHPTPAFPHFKIRVTPHATIPAELAPENANCKTLEDGIKVVVPVGGKVYVTWETDTSTLLETHADDDDLHTEASKIVDGMVESWLIENLDVLGIERYDKQCDSLFPELVLSPSAAVPSRAPVGEVLLPLGEPVATLQKLELSLAWALPGQRGKRTADSRNDITTAINALTFENIFDEEPFAPKSPPESQRQRGAHPKPPAEVDADRLAEVVRQVTVGMKKVITLQMIRRFPYVFDSEFLEYQSTLVLPPALATATGRFITLAARHNRPLRGKCASLLQKMAKAQHKTIKTRVTTMARLPTQRRPHKKAKRESQSSDVCNSQEHEDEDEAVERILAHMDRLRVDEPDASAGVKLHRTLAWAVAAVGADKWASSRTGTGRMAAWRTPLAEGESPEKDTPEGALPPADLTPNSPDGHVTSPPPFDAAQIEPLGLYRQSLDDGPDDDYYDDFAEESEDTQNVSCSAHGYELHYQPGVYSPSSSQMQANMLRLLGVDQYLSNVENGMSEAMVYDDLDDEYDDSPGRSLDHWAMESSHEDDDPVHNLFEVNDLDDSEEEEESLEHYRAFHHSLLGHSGGMAPGHNYDHGREANNFDSGTPQSSNSGSTSDPSSSFSPPQLHRADLDYIPNDIDVDTPDIHPGVHETCPDNGYESDGDLDNDLDGDLDGDLDDRPGDDLDDDVDDEPQGRLGYVHGNSIENPPFTAVHGPTLELEPHEEYGSGFHTNSHEDHQFNYDEDLDDERVFVHVVHGQDGLRENDNYSRQGVGAVDHGVEGLDDEYDCVDIVHGEHGPGENHHYLGRDVEEFGQEAEGTNDEQGSVHVFHGLGGPRENPHYLGQDVEEFDHVPGRQYDHARWHETSTRDVVHDRHENDPHASHLSAPDNLTDEDLDDEDLDGNNLDKKDDRANASYTSHLVENDIDENGLQDDFLQTTRFGNVLDETNLDQSNPFEDNLIETTPYDNGLDYNGLDDNGLDGDRNENEPVENDLDDENEADIAGGPYGRTTYDTCFGSDDGDEQARYQLTIPQSYSMLGALFEDDW